MDSWGVRLTWFDCKGEEIVHNCDNVYLFSTSEKCNQNSKCEKPLHEPLVKQNSIFVRFIGRLV